MYLESELRAYCECFDLQTERFEFFGGYFEVIEDFVKRE